MSRYKDSVMRFIVVNHYDVSFADDVIAYEAEYIAENGKTYTFSGKLYRAKDKIIYLNFNHQHAWTKPTEFLFRYADTLFSRKLLENNKESGIADIYDIYEDCPSIFKTGEGGLILDEKYIPRSLVPIFSKVASRDSIGIIRMCHSFSTENIAYGAVGLYLWRSFIGELDCDAELLLKKIETLDLEVFFNGGGCIISSEPMKIALGMAEFSIYSQFSEYIQQHPIQKKPHNDYQLPVITDI